MDKKINMETTISQAAHDALAAEEEEWKLAESRMAQIAQNGNDGTHYKQERYTDEKGEDWIDECARTLTPEEFRGAMKFTIGKYLRRIGKKDSLVSEIEKIRDYAQRWGEYENEQ